MPKVYSKALEKHIEVGRYIGKYIGEVPGPSIIFTAGIHGNEPAGVFALHSLLQELKEQKPKIRGNIYALAGNLPALEKGDRYSKNDLNRLWDAERVSAMEAGNFVPEDRDSEEQTELYDCICEILEQDEGPFYFMDLHSTSSQTVPFLVVNDMLLNRRYTSQYPLPIILGIEEYLHGPLLSYINELGYVAFGFEAGRHDDRSTIRNHKAFAYLSLVFTGILPKGAIDFEHYYKQLASDTEHMRHFYEIFYRYSLQEGESFTMAPGYANFQEVKKGELLATSNGRQIKADRDARVFMPLYQSQGSEGFFAIRKIPKRILGLSARLRKLKLDHLLPLLPGVKRPEGSEASLRVNRKTARFYTKAFFHLMGYRRYRLDKTHYLMQNREMASREEDYRNEPWW